MRMSISVCWHCIPVCEFEVRDIKLYGMWVYGI